jgi:hypothetical protein|nr:MAG TPA: hypothetical protein [Caudoviricetes sp.]
MAMISKRSRGSVNDMLAAMKDALRDQTVEQSTIAAASDIDLEYISEVEQAVLDRVESEADDIVFQEADDALYCTVAYNEHITNFEIPYGDLSMNDVDLDANYIANSIIESIEETLGHRDNE